MRRKEILCGATTRCKEILCNAKMERKEILCGSTTQRKDILWGAKTWNKFLRCNEAKKSSAAYCHDVLPRSFLRRSAMT